MAYRWSYHTNKGNNMKKTIIATLVLIASSSAFGNWIHMSKTGAQSIDIYYSKCFYKQISGNFSVSIVIKGGTFSCPYSIRYNPVTNQWK